MTKLDQRWFSKYEEIGRFDDINFLNPINLLEQKKLFLVGETDNPSFEYDIDLQDLLEKEIALRGLYGEIEQEEHDDIVGVSYFGKINEQLKKIQLLKAVQVKDDQSFTKISKEIYGSTTDELFSMAVNSIFYFARKFNIEPGSNLLELESVVKDNFAPNFEFKNEDNSPTLSSGEIKKHFEEKLKQNDISWEVVLDELASSITLSYQKKKVLIPARRTITKNALEGLLAHEVEVHLTRFINGLNSPLLLLSAGLERYLKGEEGLALYFETNKFKNKFPGTANYLSVVLAQEQRKSFREVYDFLCDYYLFLDHLSKKEISKIEISEKAWKTCVKVFRGTTGVGRGNCFTRELVYFAGFSEVVEIFNSNSLETDRWSVGKYDPANSDHLNILNKLNL